MNRIIIPSILVITVLIASVFAFSPVENAATVHTTGTVILADGQSAGISVTQSLDGIFADGTTSTSVIRIDSTNIGNIIEGHFAAVLPADDNGGCASTGNPDGNITLLVGQAGVELDDDVLAGTSTILTGAADVTFDGNTRDMCIFHGNFDTSDTNNGLITDVVLVLADGILPDNSYITVSVDIDSQTES